MTAQLLRCRCGQQLHVREGHAACLLCHLVATVRIAVRTMTPPEIATAKAALRGERLPEPEPTVTAKEGLR